MTLRIRVFEARVHGSTTNFSWTWSEEEESDPKDEKEREEVPSQGAYEKLLQEILDMSTSEIKQKLSEKLTVQQGKLERKRPQCPANILAAHDARSLPQPV